MTDLPAIELSSVIFATTAFSIHVYVQKNGPIPFSRQILRLNSAIYSIVSLFFVLQIGGLILRLLGTSSAIGIQETAHKILLQPSTDPKDKTLRYLYHLSKFWEYVDIFSVLATGSSIGIAFSFHHLTTPYLTYARALTSPAGWQIFALFNALHHVLMYAAFAGVDDLLGIVVLPYILPYTLYFQLVVGIAVEAWIVKVRTIGKEATWETWYPLWPNILCTVLLAIYVGLFMRRARLEKKQKSKEE
ncbi:hypothetical protein BDQ12DRAFT_730189 [Crucibulum laeve]|uniref:Uncharacterized protein n=1 Tax=Crucibulum laeve TaxID=68775 RepID=A0A5C3MF84_9AGAR|nr:hypothetical protein BDQ12DRAFT_730189 [Crucibulum laeve]